MHPFNLKAGLPFRTKLIRSFNETRIKHNPVNHRGRKKRIVSGMDLAEMEMKFESSAWNILSFNLVSFSFEKRREEQHIECQQQMWLHH